MRADRQTAARHIEAMHAQPLKPLEHDAALAQEIVRDDGLRDVGEPVRRRIDRALQHRVALGHEHDDMAICDPLHALDQQLGGDRIDEIGEQDDQRAALEPRIELGEAEGEIGLLMMVVEARRWRAGCARSSTRRGRGRRYWRTAASKPNVPTRSPPCSETHASSSPALIAWSSRGMAVDRLEHEIAGIEGQHDLVIALGAKLLAQQLAMARRMLPVDEAAVEAGCIFAQRFELGPFAALLLRLDAVDRLLREELQGRAVHAAHVGQHVDRSRSTAIRRMNSTSPSGPRQRTQIRSISTRPRRRGTTGRRDLRLLPGRELAAIRFPPARPRRAARRSARRRWPGASGVAAIVTVIAPRSPI